MFAANYTSGIQLISSEEAEVFLEKLEPTKIERFYGTYHQRKEAVRRAHSKIGDKTYNLIFNNCEHYKNLVHFSQKYSPQVENAGKVAMISDGITAIAGATSGNNKALGWGLLIFALGAIATNAANQEE
jgi:transcriptional regulator of aromatic amino acid metabolism